MCALVQKLDEVFKAFRDEEKAREEFTMMQQKLG